MAVGFGFHERSPFEVGVSPARPGHAHSCTRRPPTSALLRFGQVARHPLYRSAQPVAVEPRRSGRDTGANLYRDDGVWEPFKTSTLEDGDVETAIHTSAACGEDVIAIFWVTSDCGNLTVTYGRYRVLTRLQNSLKCPIF